MPESTTDRHTRLVNAHTTNVQSAILLVLGAAAGIILDAQYDFALIHHLVRTTPLLGVVLLFLWMGHVALFVKLSIETMHELRHVRATLTHETEE